MKLQFKGKKDKFPSHIYLQNCNDAIIGQTSSGKSYLCKTLLELFLKNNKKNISFIFSKSIKYDNSFQDIKKKFNKQCFLYEKLEEDNILLIDQIISIISQRKNFNKRDPLICQYYIILDDFAWNREYAQKISDILIRTRHLGIKLINIVQY